MRVTSLLTESSLTEIAERLYANLTDSSRKLAESALLNANPNLTKKSAAFLPGAIIQVPVIPSLIFKTADFALEDPIGQTRDAIAQELTRYQIALKETVSFVRTEIEGQIKFLDQNDVAKVLNKYETLLIPKNLKSELKKRIEDNEKRYSTAAVALEQATNDLKTNLEQ